MFAAKLKTNARKSTHSGKVRLGLSSFQDRHWQDVSGYSPQAKLEGRSSVKIHSSLGQVAHNSKGGSSSSNSSDRSIWDTKFTELEPVAHDSSDQMIWNLKPLPKFKIKGCLASPEITSESDRNIFSALGKPNTPSKIESDSGLSTSFHEIHRSRQLINASRNLSNRSSRSNKDFIFKKPTAPPPVSRVHLSGSGSIDRSQKQPSSSTSASKSGQVRSQQKNSKRSHASKTVRFVSSVTKSHDGARSKRLQHSISFQKLSRPVRTSNMLDKDEIYSPLIVERVHRKNTAKADSHGIEELEAYIDNQLNIQKVQVRSAGKASSPKASMSSSKNKPGKDQSKPDTRWSITSTRNIQSQKPSQHLGCNFSSSPVKKIHAKSTGTRKQSAVRGPPQTLRNKPIQSCSSGGQYAAPVVQSSPIIDLCKPATSQRSVMTRLRATAKASPQNQSPQAQGSIHVHLKANRSIYSPKGDLSHPRGSSSENVKTLKASQPHKAQSASLIPRKDATTPQSKNLPKNHSKSLPQKNPINYDAGNRTTSLPKEPNNSKSIINHGHKSSTKDKAIIPLNRLEVRLSPMKIQKGDSGEYDDIDGNFFASFGTQSELESYLRSQPEEMQTRGQQATFPKSSLFEVKHCADSKPSTSLEGKKSFDQKQLKQYQQQLVADLWCCSSHEILHPRLVSNGFSIRKELIAKGVKSTNLKACGICFKVQKLKSASRSRRRVRLTEHRKDPKTTKLEELSFIKERSATPTTGLKIKFTIPGRKVADTNDPAESKSTPEAASNKTSQLPVEEAESKVPKVVIKLPVEESIPFKPFEKEVMSSKSAFVSDALDKYLQDEEKQSVSVTGTGHPLLQSKASSVTFKMPSKQSSYIKTLDMALQERQMAKYKSKVPSVAETAEKLAKSLKHTSDTFKMSSPLQSPKEKEAKKSSKTMSHSDSRKTADPQVALKDKQVKQSPWDLSSPRIYVSTKPKSKEVILVEKRRFLEEKLENVKKKLMESNAFLKKSSKVNLKGKSQTSWATKLKIVNSRLIQQLKSPARNAHLIKAKVDGLKSPQQTEDELKAGGDGSECKSVEVTNTDKSSRKRKGKNKTPVEFVRLDQQTKCDNDFCRLGCICESINLNLPVEKLTKHCRKLTCMFECNCQRYNVRILRNRKRPTIFQEKSMLFYDGVGMFSNSNNCFLEEPSSSGQERKKPGILGPNRGLCARAIAYKPKPKCEVKNTKTGSSQQDELQGQSSPVVEASQSRSLPNQDLSNSRSTKNLSLQNAKQEYSQLNRGQPQGSTVPGKMNSSDIKASDVVPSVLYTPVQVPLSGQHGSVILYAPVNPLPYMVQKVQVPSSRQQPSCQVAKGNKTSLLTADYSQPGVLQVANNSDPKTGDNMIKPVAVINPLTASSASQTDDKKMTNTGASVTAQYVNTDSSCKVCQVMQSGELNLVFGSSSLEAINKGHTCTMGSDKSLKKSSPLPGVPTNSAQTVCEKESAATSIKSPTRNEPDDSETSQCVDSANGKATHSPRLSGKETNNLEAPTFKMTEAEILADVSRGSENIHDTTRSEDQELTGRGQNDHPTSVTNSDTSSSASAAQTSEESENEHEVCQHAERMIRAVVTKTKSPVSSPITSPAAGSCSTKGNLAHDDTKLSPLASSSLVPSTSSQSPSAKFSSAVTDLTKRLDTKTSNTSLHGNSAIKVPAFSYTTEPKFRYTSKSKLTKTQVFLPGTSMSAISSKHSMPHSRSPLLIEIQSECNWAGTKNDILSTIAKHTSTPESTPGVVRVGKFLVEILSKDEQKNIAINKKKGKYNEQVVQTAPISSTKRVEHLTPRYLPSKTPHSNSSQQAGLSRDIIKPPQEEQSPCIGKSSLKESSTYKYVPNNPGNRLMNFANAGTLTAAAPSGKAPLLASLPPGSIMLSDGKNAAGYLVPLKAVQDHLNVKTTSQKNAGSKPPTSTSTSKSESMTQMSISQITQTTMPVMGPIGSSIQKKSSPRSSSPNSSSKTDAAQTSSHTDSQSSSTSAMISATSSANCEGLKNIDIPLPGNTEEIKPDWDADLKAISCDALSYQVAAFMPGLESINQQSKPSDRTDVLKLFQGGDLQIETSENSVSSGNKPDVPADVPGLAEDPEEFIDVESLDGVQPTNPPFSKHLPRLLKPSSASTPPIFPVALTSDAVQAASVYVPIAPKTSRRKVEHQVRPSVLIEDPDENVDVVSCDDTSKAHRWFPVTETPTARIAGGGSQSHSSSGNKRKRKSPVVQKKSAMVFEEPEFIESYYEVSSGGEDDGEEDTKKFKRDKPNKVLHLIKERQRRRDQSDLFGGLKNIMLKNRDNRVAKVAILEMALKEIKLLESMAFSTEVEKTKLKQEVFQKRTKLASLLGVSILNFPSSFSNQKDPDFDEYLRELHDGSDGIVSSAQSETTSQDSESIDMDSSDGEDDDEGITREQLQRMSDIEPKSVLKVEPKDDSGNSNLTDVVGVESQSQTTIDDPTPATTSETPARHLGLPKTVPGASATSRVVLKPQPSRTQPSVGDTLKGPVPIALTALPFDFNMTSPRTTPQTAKTVSESIPSLDPVVKNHSSDTPPDSEMKSIEDVGEVNKDLVACYPTNAVPVNLTLTSSSKTSSSDNDLSEKDLKITSNISKAASPIAPESSSDQDSEIKEFGEMDSQTTLNDNTETCKVNPKSKKDPSLSLSETFKECDMAESSKKDNGISVDHRTGVSPQKVNQCKDNLSNIPSVSSKDNGKIGSSRQDADSKVHNSLLAHSDNDNDVEMISFNEEQDSEIILVEDDGTDPPLSNKQTPGQKSAQSSPEKGSPSKSSDKRCSPSTTDSSGTSLSINILSIQTKGGVVRVTCDNGEVIPLAVVSASSDGTMQVAVEGDISSEKVEELLSKTEVMECLEKVADDTYKKLTP